MTRARCSGTPGRVGPTLPGFTPAVDAAPLAAAEPAYTGDLIRAALQARSADFAPLADLARTTGVARHRLLAAVTQHTDLGTCGPTAAPLIWTLPPEVLGTGFVPQHRRGRLVLYLSGRAHGRPPLLVTGERLGPGTAGGESTGLGELNHTIRRLTLLARRWLTPPGVSATTPELTRRLFELTAQTWPACANPVWSDGRLRIFQADHPEPVANGSRTDGRPTPGVELVTWLDHDGRFLLANLYPADTHRAILGKQN